MTQTPTPSSKEEEILREFDKTFQQDKTGEKVANWLFAVPAYLYPKEEQSAMYVKIATPDDVKTFLRSALSTIRKDAYEQGLKQNHFEIDKANMKWTKETPEGIQFLKDIVKDAEEKARKQSMEKMISIIDDIVKETTEITKGETPFFDMAIESFTKKEIYTKGVKETAQEILIKITDPDTGLNEK